MRRQGIQTYALALSNQLAIKRGFSPAEAAPELEVVPYRTAWAYADPALEQASAGHRLLFRLGPENAAAVKAKLRELRAAVASTELTP